MLETVAEDGNKAVSVTGGVKSKAILPHRVYLILPLKPGPLLGLSSPDKVDQSVNVQAQRWIIGAGALGVAAGGGEQGGFDVGFKTFFSCYHFAYPYLHAQANLLISFL